MKRQKAILGVLVVSVIFGVSYSADRTPAVKSPATQPAKTEKMRFHHPVVIDAQDPLPGRSNFLWIAPAEFCWTGQGVVLVSARGLKNQPAVDFWREIPTAPRDKLGELPRAWTKIGQLEGVMWPTAFLLGDEIGIIGTVGQDIRGGYGNSVMFFRVAGGKNKHSEFIYKPPSPQDRLTVCSVNVRDKTISVFMLLEIRGQRLNRLLFSQSTDGGKTWPKQPTLIATTTMHEDYSRLGSFQFSPTHLGLFVVEGQTLLFYRSKDGGKTWAKETVRLSDDIGAKTRRLPLAKVKFKGGFGLIYLAVDPSDRSIGRYYFTRSADKGKTWQAGVAVTKPLKLDDPAIFARATASGDWIAMSFVETTGRWTKGEMRCRLVLSNDGGKTWNSKPLEKYYNGVALFSALGSTLAENRILFATAICMDPKSNPRNYLVVQELSLRAVKRTKLNEEDRKAIADLIGQLGDGKYAVRASATRKLTTYGLAAERQLRQATKSKDLEVRLRAEHVLRQFFPECIRFSNEQHQPVKKSSP